MTVIPIIIGSFGTVSTKPELFLALFGGAPFILIHKVSLLGTAHILGEVLDIKELFTAGFPQSDLDALDLGKGFGSKFYNYL